VNHRKTAKTKQYKFVPKIFVLHFNNIVTTTTTTNSSMSTPGISMVDEAMGCEIIAKVLSAVAPRYVVSRRLL